MKRYDIDQNSLFSNDDGDWVQYEDVKALEIHKTNLAESCIKLKETARLDRMASLQELAAMSKQVEELYADKIEFEKLKEGIRNLKGEFSSNCYWVSTEDLEKLLKGDK